MASVWMLLLLNALFTSALSLDVQLIKVYPKQPILGVFEVTLGNKYDMDASAARDVCEHLGVTIASKAQVVEAHKHGLETCRFGWIDEQIAVVPRVQVKPNCGNGNVGVAVWRADVSMKFDVFCFNSTDFEIQNQATTADQTSTEKPMTATVEPFTSPPLGSSSVPSAHKPDLKDLEAERRLSISGKPSSVGVVPVALLITITFAVLLAVFLALYHFKINRRCRKFCDAERRQEDIETDVWEHCSKKDLQTAQEQNVQEKEEEENNNNNSSSDQD